MAPKVSATERTALEAGSVSWDGELFSGKPQWEKLLAFKDDGLRDDEKPSWPISVLKQRVCATPGTLPRNALTSPAALGLSKRRLLRHDHSEGVRRPWLLSQSSVNGAAKLSANETLMVTVGVPNSLGPGELLLKYGTQEQKDHYLPRLSDGREIPCFGLTGPALVLMPLHCPIPA
ncbi:hypothetical protein HSBAA_27480 [Vreelandella sulfidaeris]|uniref:Acyl-CoA dehydrogenase/oxidase N-terminal domain-containing protein n=1 Tax=Vreelandella sulfidaeris TaxID=115553 RepID=A0A455U5P3_9GAMM|nr:hypothetical protein HSBAA_27480 [Halomonas sulfidaeris]